MSEQKTGKVKNISGEDLVVGWLGGRLVVATQTVEVPIGDVWSYTQQAETWEPADAPAKKAHKEHLEAALEREAAELAAIQPDPEAEARAAAAEESSASAAGETEKQES